MIEVEVQNETYQTQQVVRFAAVPRIGEGIHLTDEAGFSACFDVVDVWYQKASYGDVWIPYIHVCKTPGESDARSMPLPNMIHVPSASAELSDRLS